MAGYNLVPEGDQPATPGYRLVPEEGAVPATPTAETAPASPPPALPESFLHRLSAGLALGWHRTEEIAAEGAGQIGAGVHELGGAHPEPPPLPPWLSDLVQGRPELDAVNRRTWQKAQALGKVLGGAFDVATAPVGMVSAPLQEATGGPGGGFPQEATEMAIGLIGPSALGAMRKAGEIAEAPRFFRMRNGQQEVIGNLPKDADFQTAAGNIAEQQRTVKLTPDEQQIANNLRDLWQERGIHPAEAAHDAETDTFLRHDLSAARTPPEDLPPDISPLVERPSLPGRLTAAMNNAGSRLLDIGHDLQMSTVPMVRGSKDAQAIAKDFANSLRRNRWDWSRIDEDIANRFTPEQRERMWNAADEESVLRQEAAQREPETLWYQGIPARGVGKPQLSEYWTTNRDLAYDYAGQGGYIHVARHSDLPEGMAEKAQGGKTDSVRNGVRRQVPTIATLPRDAAASEFEALAKPAISEHMGLATLEPEERAAVEDLQARGQAAWLRARDLGMVEGEGLPAYTPRMVINIAAATGDQASLPLNSIGHNLRTTTAQLKRRKYLTAEETEAAAKEKFGAEAGIARDIRALPLATGRLEDAIAGRVLVNQIKDYGKRTGAETVVEGSAPVSKDLLEQPEHKWFTIDHPSLKTWRPRFEEVDGKTVAAKDADGNTIFEQVPLYIRGDFEGPLRAVLSQKNGALYNAMMDLKGKTMGLIMNSPLIHNAVEWGRALPAMPGKVATFKIYFEGNRAKNDVGLMHEAIDAGLVPIGHRFFKQDIESVMEQPNLAPGRSWTAQVLGAVPDLFNPKAGDTVKRAIDKAGDFWHNTLLWDRVGDLQMGLYTNFRDDLLAKGVDRQTATIASAHWANRYAGSLPVEAMSANARKISNFLMFSRTFTLGNIGAMKDMFAGLPQDALAQIERAGGVMNPEARGYMKSLARRKAMMVVALDVGLMYVGNSILQSTLNVMRGDKTMDEEMHGYAERLSDALQERKENPWKLLQPFDFLGHLSSTFENEPGKQDRIKIGHAADGTAIYMRNPVGKIGEEFTDYISGDWLDMVRRKLGTIAKPGWEIMANDKGFGRKVYDPDADTPAKYMGNIAEIAKTFFESQLPETQLGVLGDLVKGDGDAKANAAAGLGPVAGFTFSKGAPGGEAVGEMFKAREMHDYAVQANLPDIRKQIQRGDIQGAQDRMTELGIPGGLQRFYIRTSQDPSMRLSGRTLRDFWQYATPEQKARFERAQGLPQQ